MSFFPFFLFVLLQRLLELFIAKRNERVMRQRGAFEFGQGHYKYMVMLHVSFLLAVLLEVTLFGRSESPLWPVLLAGFVAVQLLRAWAILSLGAFWNTKIIVLPGAEVVAKGPYKYIRHPNYMVVIVEFLLIPLLFQAYFTAVLFSILNVLLLRVRIRAEEKALMEATAYEKTFANRSRFTPKRY
ncbi:isoprenylcysteine carboxyl methyltransferase family protein [Ectobacillus ponti]|uniref:isoprenylcysteine carboxyl methyltransferase family protein n=1 Tax=Ectobacillus ponti TaxID=2961894 RepID=UPI0034D26067